MRGLRPSLESHERNKETEWRKEILTSTADLFLFTIDSHAGNKSNEKPLLNLTDTEISCSISIYWESKALSDHAVKRTDSIQI